MNGRLFRKTPALAEAGLSFLASRPIAIIGLPLPLRSTYKHMMCALHVTFQFRSFHGMVSPATRTCCYCSISTIGQVLVVVVLVPPHKKGWHYDWARWGGIPWARANPSRATFQTLAQTFWGWLGWPRGKWGDSNNSAKAWCPAMLPLVWQKSRVWRLQIDEWS